MNTYLDLLTFWLALALAAVLTFAFVHPNTALGQFVASLFV